ncbi:hypothetical protein [Spongiactinospora rosea]|uniref:hypothetical protein n=1 Tax=Spongiactinospora rosea TaxID=2248750 RepID=UPI0011C02496|nr:hypothetical protein [Spongiactinospora rosea]
MTLAAAATLVAAGCTVSAPDGPPGVVIDSFRVLTCAGRPTVCKTRYRLKVRPAAGGEPVRIAVSLAEHRACRPRSAYPACLTRKEV